MILASRRSTRDIAVAAEAVATAHVESDREIVRRFEQMFTDQQQARQSMHEENKKEFSLIHERINKLTDRVSSMPMKIISIFTGIIIAFVALLQYIWHGAPHL